MKRRLPTPVIIALALLAVAAVLMVAGIADDQPLRVWQKAAMICYECIGLG